MRGETAAHGKTIVSCEPATPYYLVDEALILRNLKLLRSVADRAGCRILLAQKAFSMYSLYPLIGEYLDGVTASGLYEARLGFEEFRRENHVFSPAYREGDFAEITRLCDHIIFNSFAQFSRFGRTALAAGRDCGIRINPECSTGSRPIYDPCAPGSRLGVTLNDFPDELPEGIVGLHFHTLCEQDFDALETTLDSVEARFGRYLHRVKWLNLGGGHHITRDGYDVDGLCRRVARLRDDYGLTIYLEPGEAVALDAGYLYTRVLDVVGDGVCGDGGCGGRGEGAAVYPVAILDASAACHMPDVLEAPYRPEIDGAGMPGERAYTYRLGGPTCLAGDIIGDYSFDSPLRPGDCLCFLDMAHYTMVKNNTFNGIPLPSIAVKRLDGAVQIVREFGYDEFRRRL